MRRYTKGRKITAVFIGILNLIGIPFDSVAYLALAALYGGGDDYWHAAQHLELGTLAELNNLATQGILIEREGMKDVRFTVHVIFVPDGLARRALSGMSSAASQHPVSSLRLHLSQVADAMMKRHGNDYFDLLDGRGVHSITVQLNTRPLFRST